MPSDERSKILATLSVESFGRLGVRLAISLTLVATNAVGVRERGSMARKGGGERMPALNRLGDHTRRHFKEGVTIEDLA